MKISLPLRLALAFIFFRRQNSRMAGSNQMKRTFTVLLAATIVAIGALGQTPAAKQPFTLVLSAVSLTVKIKSPMLITLQLTNTSEHEIPPGWWGQNSLGVIEQADVFDVRDGQGHPLVKQQPDPKSDFIIGNGAVGRIQPGQSNSFTQDFARWYDLNRPGKYTIRASRPFSENEKKGVVTSNELTITVTK
jgi:hypothetical protein